MEISLKIINSICLKFPVFCVIFPDFSSLFEITRLFPDWKMSAHFPVQVGTPIKLSKNQPREK